MTTMHGFYGATSASKLKATRSKMKKPDGQLTLIILWIAIGLLINLGSHVLDAVIASNLILAMVR